MPHGRVVLRQQTYMRDMDDMLIESAREARLGSLEIRMQSQKGYALARCNGKFKFREELLNLWASRLRHDCTNGVRSNSVFSVTGSLSSVLSYLEKWQRAPQRNGTAIKRETV
jgi:hypothetical protein